MGRWAHLRKNCSTTDPIATPTLHPSFLSLPGRCKQRVFSDSQRRPHLAISTFSWPMQGSMLLVCNPFLSACKERRHVRSSQLSLGLVVGNSTVLNKVRDLERTNRSLLLNESEKTAEDVVHRRLSTTSLISLPSLNGKDPHFLTCTVMLHSMVLSTLWRSAKFYRLSG